MIETGTSLINTLKKATELLGVENWEVELQGDWRLSFENPDFDTNNCKVGDWISRDVDLHVWEYADYHVGCFDDDGEWGLDFPKWRPIFF